MGLPGSIRRLPDPPWAWSGHGRPPYAGDARRCALHQLCNSPGPISAPALYGSTARPGTLPRMNEWPEGWTDDRSGDRYGRGSGSAQPEGARAMPQVQRDAGGRAAARRAAAAAGAVPRRGTCRRSSPRATTTRYDSGYNTGQVYGGGRGGGGRGGRRPAATAPRPRAELAPPDQDRTVAHPGRSCCSSARSARTSGPTPSSSREVDLSKVIDRPDGGRRHQLPDRRLGQPRGHVRRGEEEAAHRLRRGQAHRLDDDPARRRATAPR